MKRTIKDALYRFGITFLVTILVILVGVVGYKIYDFYHMPEFEAGEVIEEIPEPTLPPVIEERDPEEETVFGPLSENVVGTLTVDGVDITNEPIMQHPTQDEFYLDHDERDNYSVWGAYFTYSDWNMQGIGTLDKVTVIFGHSNGNSLYRKFSVLKHFKDATYAKNNQYIYMTIGGVCSRWQTFAVADYPVANNFAVANPDEEYFMWEIEQMKALSYNQYATQVSADDKILILATCSGENNYDTRFIVCAKLVDIF